MTIAEACQSAKPEGPGVAGRNPFVFVVGCQRSGTTMLQRMLSAHPALVVGYDSLFIPQVIKGLPVGEDPVLSAKIVETVRTYPRFGRLELPEEAVERAAARSERYSAFIESLYDELAALHGKQLAGEKSPGYCRHLPRLNALLPWTRVIHLIRDGRDVALSIRDWGRGAARLELAQREPIAAAALWWRRDVTRGLADGRAIDQRLYMEVRYEDLVADAEASLRCVATFLGLSFTADMVEYHKGKQRYGPGYSTKAAWLPPTPGIRDWRTQMSERERDLFEALAGEQLEVLGYGRTCVKVSGSVRAVAEECEAWWRRNEE